MAAALGLNLSPRRRRRVDRHLRYRVLPVRHGPRRPQRFGLRLRRRHRPLPPARLHRERLPHPFRHRQHSSASTTTNSPTWHWPGNPARTDSPCCPTSTENEPPTGPTATGVLHGLTSVTSREDLARAAVEALLCSLADAVDALHTRANRILLIGGGSRNPAVQQLAPAIFGMPVHVPPPGEYVALGAARQAAWALVRHPGTPHLGPAVRLRSSPARPPRRPGPNTRCSAMQHPSGNDPATDTGSTTTDRFHVVADPNKPLPAWHQAFPVGDQHTPPAPSNRES